MSIAWHGCHLCRLEKALVSLVFVGFDGEAWLLENHGMQVRLSHRISVLGGIVRALGAAVGQRERSSQVFPKPRRASPAAPLRDCTAAHGWSGSWASSFASPG